MDSERTKMEKRQRSSVRRNRNETRKFTYDDDFSLITKPQEMNSIEEEVDIQDENCIFCEMSLSDCPESYKILSEFGGLECKFCNMDVKNFITTEKRTGTINFEKTLDSTRSKFIYKCILKNGIEIVLKEE